MSSKGLSNRTVLNNCLDTYLPVLYTSSLLSDNVTHSHRSTLKNSGQFNLQKLSICPDYDAYLE